MTQLEEYDESHNVDDSMGPGPGAPTPLSALEVSPWTDVFGALGMTHRIANIHIN
jgi:hypothetical protein